MKPIRCLGILALMGAVPGAAPVEAIPIFVNGDLEAGVSTGWNSMNGVNTPGWIITTGTSGFFPALNLNLSCGGPFGNFNEGCQFGTLGGPRDEPGGGSAMSQTIAGFTTGDSYVLSWLQSSEFTEGDWVRATITGAGVVFADYQSVPFPGPGLFWQGWQTMLLPFVADATTLTFQFQSAPGHGFHSEPGVDDFRLAGDDAAPVPEPATLLLVGGGLVVAGWRRRRLNPRA